MKLAGDFLNAFDQHTGRIDNFKTFQVYFVEFVLGRAMGTDQNRAGLDGVDGINGFQAVFGKLGNDVFIVDNVPQAGNVLFLLQRFLRQSESHCEPPDKTRIFQLLRLSLTILVPKNDKFSNY